MTGLNMTICDKIIEFAEKVFLSKDKEYLITAPTGSGKTVGFIQYSIHSSKKIVFVMPTNSSIRFIQTFFETQNINISNLVFMTQNHFISYLLRDNVVIDIVVLDECHVDSDESEFIKLYLKKFPHIYSKLIMLSATCPIQNLKKFFPKIQEFKITPFREKKIDTFYLDFEMNQHNPQFSLYELFKTYINRNIHRVIVFCYSSSQCEVFSEYFASLGYKTFAYYSKMQEETQDEFLDYVKNTNNSFIVFSTNALETSVTIPDINYVFDFGKRFVYENNTLKLKWCDKSSMIQRAGRTGRTCNGKVIRLMTRQFFSTLPDLEQYNYNFESILLSLYKKQKNELMNQIFEKDIIQKFQNKINTLYIQSPIQNLKFDFVYRYRNDMPMEDSVLLYKLYKHRFDYSITELFFMYLTITLIVSLDTTNLPLFYIPKNIRRNKRAFFTRIKRKFDSNNHKDELKTYLTIIFNAFVYGKKFIENNNLNNKFIQDVKKRFLRYWNDSVTTCKIKDFPSFFETNFTIKKESPYTEQSVIYGIFECEFKNIQEFLYLYTNLPVYTIPHVDGNDHQNAIHEIFNYDDLIYYTTSLKIIAIKEMNIQHTEDYTDNKIILWTRMRKPSFAKQYSNKIDEQYQYRVEKNKWKDEFKNVLCEIQDEVAYRPGKCKMFEAMDDFYTKMTLSCL
jgi:hypothetical protein